MENNLGYINTVFIQNADNLFKTANGRKLIKEYINIIINNKNLLKEYSVYEYIGSQNYSEDIKDKITEAINILNKINKKQLEIDHLKLSKLLEENKIVEINNVENKLLFENINNLIFSSKSIKSINENISITKSIVEHISSKTEQIKENIPKLTEQTISYLTKKFNDKYASAFTEEQKEIFKNISSIDEIKQMNVFETIKKECLELTNNFLKEDIDNDTREKLLGVKEKLLEDKFSEKTFIEDILKYMDLKSTLED